MKIMGMGLDMAGNRLFAPLDEDAAFGSLVRALAPNADAVQSLAATTKGAVAFRGEVERAVVDLGDPRVAGWSFLVSSADPQRDEIVAILEPLAAHRGMADPKAPLLYNGESPDEWFEWLQNNYYALALEGEKVPHYILIAGGPDQIPFRFQSTLSTAASVGRIDLDTMDDLKGYVDKLIRIETAPAPLVTRDAILFAPDAGAPDPTYFSREYMIKPIGVYIEDDLGLHAETIAGVYATKTRLLEALGDKTPALVYTASHGLGAMDEPFAVQKRYNGAICCQHTGPLSLDSLFSADDVPLDRPFLEGSIFFQFACFGYGTPAESDYTHWLEGVPERYTESDFVAALPKRLLAHPRGPIAFIGHLDTAFLHAFADAEAPHTLDRWHNRIEPFVTAVNRLLSVQPSGLAMEDMSKRYNNCNTLLALTYDRQRRGKLKWNAVLQARFLDTWITRSDAQNYMIFGDPAVRLRIPA